MPTLNSCSRRPHAPTSVRTADSNEARWDSDPPFPTPSRTHDNLGPDQVRQGLLCEDPLKTTKSLDSPTLDGNGGESRLQGDVASDSVSPIAEKQAHLQICLEIANGHGLPSSEQMQGASPADRDVIDYHNSNNFMTILGELVGDQRARRLTRIVIRDTPPTSAKSNVLPALDGLRESGHPSLDSRDLEYLTAKGVFNLPVKPIWYVLSTSVRRPCRADWLMRFLCQ
jgi:hypothetical protein